MHVICMYNGMFNFENLLNNGHIGGRYLVLYSILIPECIGYKKAKILHTHLHRGNLNGTTKY